MQLGTVMVNPWPSIIDRTPRSAMKRRVYICIQIIERPLVIPYLSWQESSFLEKALRELLHMSGISDFSTYRSVKFREKQDDTTGFL